MRMEAEATKTSMAHFVMQDAINSLLKTGQVDVEANTVYDASGMQAARFSARSHSSSIKMSDQITLISTIDSEGHVKTRMDGRAGQHDVTSGLLYFVPEGVHQEYEFDGTTRNTLITLDTTLVQRVKEDNPEFRSAPTDDPRMAFRNPRLARKMAALIELAARQDMGWRSMTEACNTQIAVELMKSLCNAVERAVKPLTRTELSAVRDFVQDNLEENIGLEEVSALLQRDIFGFGRSFKSATGMTFHQYLTQMRVDQARRLLTETAMPLVEIAYACGFSSQAHLTTVVGRHLGLTPGTIRQQAQA
ncbi:AraC family transcriptional regulator [uncultured Tateyamaria sp.]|uniref:helix-turn-helix domain-containing protein n=1 Tax=uncultured Tateyamaria sp. TaxID=455651 RepID=UPI0026302C4B|nr:AraC family transcriptional regulator [uncultured Tateyamaria sp.]